MPVFEYLAVDATGQEMRGRISADGTRAAVAELRGQQIFVTEIREAAEQTPKGSGTGRQLDLSAWRSVRGVELVFFFHQLAFMLRAGLPVLQALQLSRTQVSSARLKQAIGIMVADIEAGLPLSQAMAGHPQVFTTLMVNLTRAGESTGELDQIMDRIALHTEKRLMLRSQILNAMIYPAVVVVATIGVGIFLVWKIIPRFEKFLAGRGKSLPPSTQTLIELSHFLRDNGLWILALVVLTVAALALAYKTDGGRRRLDAWLLRIPVLGRQFTHSAMAQMNWTLSALLRSGLTARDGLIISAGVVGNRVVSEKLRMAAEMILAGRDLSSSLRHRAIPEIVVQMIAVGERSGTLDQVLQELGLYYEQMLQNGIRRLSAMVEPAMILIIGGMVGFVYYSFFQAMFKLAGR